MAIGEQTKNNPIFKINFWITICSFTLLRIATVFVGRENFSLQNIGGIFLFAGILMNILFLHQNKVKLELRRNNVIFFLALLVIWVVAILRSAITTDLWMTVVNLRPLVELLVFLGFGFLSLAVNQAGYPQFDLHKAIIYSAIVLIATNLLLYALGINPEDTIYLVKYPAQILSIFGIHTFRVLFPLATGINNYGVFVGIVLVGSVILWAPQKGWKKWIISCLSVVLCLTTLLMVDSRSSIAFSLMTLFIIFLPKSYFSIFRWFPFLISLLPIYLLLVPQNLIQTSFSFMNRERIDFQRPLGISEQQNCDLFNQNLTGVLSNRPVIWNAGFADLANFNTNHFWGYGYQGQIISGVSSQYSCLFLSHSRNNVAGLHNIWLQHIFDTGYLGTLLLMISSISIVFTLSAELKKRSSSRVFLGILLYCILVGSLEAIFTPDYIYVYLILFYIFLTTILKPREELYAINP